MLCVFVVIKNDNFGEHGKTEQITMQIEDSIREKSSLII